MQPFVDRALPVVALVWEMAGERLDALVGFRRKRRTLIGHGGPGVALVAGLQLNEDLTRPLFRQHLHVFDFQGALVETRQDPDDVRAEVVGGAEASITIDLNALPAVVLPLFGRRRAATGRQRLHRPNDASSRVRTLSYISLSYYTISK